MPSRLQDKVSIVTGSSSGLGRAIALRYAQEGAAVVCADLRPSARIPGLEESETDTHELIQRTGGKAIFVKTDVGSAKEMESLVEAAVKEYGRLDMSVTRRRDNGLLLTRSSRLVNNAGVGLEALRPPASCHTTDEDLWDMTMKINTKSVFLGCKYALAQMLKQEPHPSGDRGWIINISSIMAMIGGPSNRVSPILFSFNY